jgi:hypothetical protein
MWLRAVRLDGSGVSEVRRAVKPPIVGESRLARSAGVYRLRLDAETQDFVEGVPLDTLGRIGVRCAVLRRELTRAQAAGDTARVEVLGLKISNAERILESAKESS